MPSGVVEEPKIKAENASSPEAAASENSAMKQKSEQKDETKGSEQGVEVVLGNERNPTVVDSPGRARTKSEQGVFRPPHAIRPQAVRAPTGPPQPPPQSYVQASGSWGYGHTPVPPPGDYRSRPYPVPPYNPSAASFEDPAYHHTPHYSPHINYPGYRSAEDVNVISPNHKGDPHYRPPHTPRRNMPPPNIYYHYPPTSPVSRHDVPPPHPNGRARSYAGRPVDGPYSRAQRGDQYHPEDGTWNRYHSRGPHSERPHPSVVTETSFDSEHHSRESQSHGSHSHPPTPRSSHVGPPSAPVPPPQDPRYQFYGGGGSWGSFDSAAGPPPHFDDQRYYGFHPDSPYGAPYHPYSSPDLYRADSFPPPPGYGHHSSSYPYSYDEDDRLKDYHSDRDGHREVTPPNRKGRATPKTSNKSNNSTNMLLPKAAEEVDFEVTDPPTEPVTPPSDKPICESLAEVNSYDVLCGRGGGTNSQIGNRRFRKLVQEFQPTYLLARRKEKPLLARTIVLIIRKRGGRFLKKDDDTGELFEVGDAKAEAKTSQALREGLDVRATKSAASSLLEKKKKKQQQAKLEEKESNEEDSPKSQKSVGSAKSDKQRDESPPTLPRLHGEEAKSGVVHPHSPDHEVYRKRRRMRTSAPADRFFPDFCPPRADLARPHSPSMHEDDGITLSATPIRRNMSSEHGHMEEPRGCAGIAFDVMTGAATGSFCLGPTGWRR